MDVFGLAMLFLGLRGSRNSIAARASRRGGQQHPRVEDPRRIEGALRRNEGCGEGCGTLLLVPRSVVAADGVMVGDGAAGVDDGL